MANFIAPSVLLGFTCGAAVLIALHALKDFFGLVTPTGTGAFGILLALVETPTEISWTSTAVGVVTLAGVLMVRRINPHLPFMLLGLLAGYGAAWLLNQFGERSVATIGTIPSAIPTFGVPDVSLQQLSELLGIAAALTIVALGQSISIAKTVAQRSGNASVSTASSSARGCPTSPAGASRPTFPAVR